MILVIDNYDSFTYNLVHYIGECNKEVQVIRNDELTLNEINSLSPEKIVISPGPCTPNEAGISLDNKHYTKSKMGLNYGEMSDITNRL